MTVKELKNLIKNLPDDMEVILQKDEEGNGYSPLSDSTTDAVYVPEKTWCGEVYNPNWSAEDVCLEEDEWEEFKKRDRVLVLCPLN